MTSISVKIGTTKIEGDLLDVVDVLHNYYKVPSPVIYKFAGEVGLAVIDTNFYSFKRPYGDADKDYFIAAVTRRKN